MIIYSIWGTLISPIFMTLCISKIGIIKITKIEIIIFYIFFTIASYLCEYKINTKYPFVYILVFCAVFLFIKHRHMTKAILTTLLATILFIISDALAAIVYVILLHDNAYNSASAYTVLALIFSSFFLFLLSLLMNQIIKKINPAIYDYKIIYIIIINLIVIFLLIYTNDMTTTYLGIKMESDYVIISGILYILYFLSSIILFSIILHYILKDNMIKNKILMIEANKKYTDDLEKSYASLCELRHDYINIINSLRVYIDEDNLEGLKKYYYYELSSINKTLLNQNLLLSVLSNIKISEVKSILLYKCSKAYEKKIHIEIEVRDAIEQLSFSTAVICQILGILLDNSIEAAEEIEDKQLYIAIIKNPSSKTFIIKNRYKAQSISINKFFEKGFSTKKGNYGIGLATVREYTNKEKYLILDTQATEMFFTQILTIIDREEN